MIKDLSEAIASVRAELRTGGKPMQTYMDAGFGSEVLSGDASPAVLRAASALTTAIMLNIEDRLLALEADRPTR